MFVITYIFLQMSYLDYSKRDSAEFYNSVTNYLDFSYSRQGQDIRYALNDDKLKKLGWKPKKEFEQELQKIVDYYKNTFIW